MQSLKQNKLLISLFFISFVAFLWYQFGPSLSQQLGPMVSGTDTTATENEQVSAEILRLLSQMQQANITADLFTSTAWQNLVDHSVPLPVDAPGRPDLFKDVVQVIPVSSTGSQR